MIQQGDYSVRRFQPCDAAGVVECVREVYGEAYPCPALYEPDKVVHENQSERWLSAVAVDRTGKVVGHSALKISSFGPVAEFGKTMVVPEHQNTGLHKQLSLLLIAEGKKAGLAGHFADLETSRPRMMDLPEHLPSHPCGLSLAMWPASAHPRGYTPIPATRRSFLHYFRPYLPLAPRVAVQVLPEHAAIVAEIYAQFGVQCANGASECSNEGGEVQVETLPAWQSMFIRVPHPGSDTAAQLHEAHRSFFADPSLETSYLELPIVHPTTPEICRQAKHLGYIFGAVIPRFFGSCDAVRLQCPKSHLDLSSIPVAHPFGQRLLAAIREEAIA